jgi:hypothetical protein
MYQYFIVAFITGFILLTAGLLWLMFHTMNTPAALLVPVRGS